MPKVYGLQNVTEHVTARRNNPALRDLKWVDTPDWVIQLISRNENEIAVSRRFYSQVLQRYLTGSGYTITDPVAKSKSVAADPRPYGKPPFDDIEMIDDDRAAEIGERILEETVTIDERIQLTKYRFIRLFKEDTEMEYLSEVWDTFFCAPFGKKVTLEAQFWNIVHERQRDLARAWKSETGQRYAEQARSTLLQQTTITKLCGVLGIENTCVEKTWTSEEFTALVPAILGMEREVRGALMLRESRSKKEDNGFNRACDFLKSVFHTWSGTELSKTGTRQQYEGLRMRIYNVSLQPIKANVWETLKTSA